MMIDILLSQRADLHRRNSRIAERRAELKRLGASDAERFDGDPVTAEESLGRALTSAREATQRISETTQRLEAQEAEIARLEAGHRNMMMGIVGAGVLIVAILIVMVAL